METSVNTLAGQEEQLISVDTGTPAPVPMSPEEAEVAAFKAQFGMSSFGATYEKMYEELLGGNEQAIRDEAAASVNLRKKMQRDRIIAEYAKNLGRALNPDDIERLDFLASPFNVPTPPDSVLEEQYADEFMDYMNITSPKRPQKTETWDWTRTVLADAEREIPDQVAKAKRSGSELLTKRELAMKEADINEKVMKDQGIFSYLWDTAKLAFPFYYESKIRGHVDSVPFYQGFGAGTHLTETAKAINRLPVPEYGPALRNIMKSLNNDNPQVGRDFIASVLGQSTDEEGLKNLFTMIDLSAIPGAIKFSTSLARRMVLNNQMNQAIKSAVKEGSVSAPTRSIIAEATGDLGEAAVQKAVETAEKGMKGVRDFNKEAIEALPSALRGDLVDIRANPGRFGWNGAMRIQDAYNNFIGNVVDAIANVMKVERIPAALANEKVMRQYRDAVKDSYPEFRNNILDVTFPVWNKVTNKYDFEILLGTDTSELFTHPITGINLAKSRGLVGYKIGKEETQKGAGYYISVAKSMNETDDIIRDALLSTSNSKTPDSWLTVIGGWLRTPDEVLSAEQRMNRKVATYASSVLLKVAKEEFKGIAKMRSRAKYTSNAKQKWDEFNRLLKAGQDKPDPDNANIKGYTYKSAGELEEEYMRLFKRMPEQDEIDAYFSFVRLTEMDRMLRNIQVYKMMSRVGADEWRLFTLDTQGKRFYSDWFAGVRRDALPGPGDGDAAVLVGTTIGKEKYIRLDKLSTRDKNKLTKDIQDGKLTVVELWDPERRPFSTFGTKVGDRWVRYAIMTNKENRPLSFEQVPRRGGGHIEYDYDFYIKQAKIRAERYGKKDLTYAYEGDATIAGVMLRSMGEKYAKNLDKVREHILRGRLDEAEALTTSTLDRTWEEVHSWFKPKRGPDGRQIPPFLNLREKIQVIPRDTMIIGINKDLKDKYINFRDRTRSGSLARGNQIEFTGQRDAHEMFGVNDKGTKYNPLFQIESAQTIDPLPSMDRALSRIINGAFMDDYKTFSVEHWLQEAREFLDYDTGEIRYSPFYVFHNPKFTRDAEKNSFERVQQLKAAHWQIQQLMGQHSKADAALHVMTHKIADGFYQWRGPNKLSNFLANAVLPRTKDPIGFLRSMTFHAKLGMFTIPQLWVQMQTFTNILGIAGGRYAIPGTFATALHAWARINKNPEILNALDKMASRMRIPGTSAWKPGQFKESVTLGNHTGFFNVAGEYALEDNVLNPKIISSGTSKFLNAGAWFFRTGERSVRMAAWHTAYKEFRDRVPTGPITNTQLRAILERADLLTANMSRASSSMLHTGVMSLPGQFYSYQLRVAELFLGKRLTGLERMRMVATYATMYGVPTSFGLLGAPFGDIIRKEAIESGYVVGEDYLKTLLAEGLPSVLLTLATGQPYNVSDRFAPQGFEFIREALHSDEAWWNIIGGAAWSTFSGTWENSDGFRKAMMSIIKGDYSQFPATIEDFVDLFKEISSVNNTWRMIMAINTGRWLSKKGAFLDKDISTQNAIFMYLSGLQPQGAADLHLMSWSLKDQKELEKHVENQFIKEFRRALQAHRDDNHNQAKKYFTRAETYLRIGGYPEQQISGLIARASKDYESLIEQINWRFYIKEAPKGEEDIRLKAFRDQFRLRQGNQ